MRRRPRIEVRGGFYYVISPGNNRRKVFQTSADYRPFTEIIKAQKSKAPIYSYAYCLMPNHIHLLIESGRIRSVRSACLFLNQDVGKAKSLPTRRRSGKVDAGQGPAPNLYYPILSGSLQTRTVSRALNCRFLYGHTLRRRRRRGADCPGGVHLL